MCLRSSWQIHRWDLVGNEPATDGEVENGLADLLDLIGAGGEAREMADEELGMGTQFFRILTVVQVMMEEAVVAPGGSPALLRCLQPITQRHQFIDFGNDAVLFCDGWNGGLATAPIFLCLE